MLKSGHLKFYILSLLSFILLVAAGIRDEKPKEQSVTYENTIRSIMQENCISCHAGNTPAAGIDFSSYKTVKKYAQWGRITDRINNERRPMPPKGMMPSEKRIAIQKWIETGYLKGDEALDTTRSASEGFLASSVVPTEINNEDIELMDKLKGLWIGNMTLGDEKHKSSSIDYRPIATSHIHGSFHAGSSGHLFTSFFITDFNGKRTIMARYGGVLNGVYKTSYLTLSKVAKGSKKSCYQFVDAYGGEERMWMELIFQGDQLKFNFYESSLGSKPKLQMQYKAMRKNQAVASDIAERLQFPQNIVDKDFSEGLPTPKWGAAQTISSATYLCKDDKSPLKSLALKSNDPYSIAMLPYLAKIKVALKQSEQTKDNPLIIYLSKEPITDKQGKLLLEKGDLKKGLADGVYSAPVIAANETNFVFQYLHPGNYYLTVICDRDANGYPSSGDLSNKSKLVRVAPTLVKSITAKEINIEN